jgi:hypothetical protein
LRSRFVGLHDATLMADIIFQPPPHRIKGIADRGTLLKETGYVSTTGLLPPMAARSMAFVYVPVL